MLDTCDWTVRCDKYIVDAISELERPCVTSSATFAFGGCQRRDTGLRARLLPAPATRNTVFVQTGRGAGDIPTGVHALVEIQRDVQSPAGLVLGAGTGEENRQFLVGLRLVQWPSDGVEFLR